jgi:hypothetical protein
MNFEREVQEFFFTINHFYFLIEPFYSVSVKKAEKNKTSVITDLV